LREALHFLAAGSVATLLHWASMAGFIEMGLGETHATAYGAALGTLANYLLQFHLTYAGRSRHTRALPAYVTNAGLYTLLNTAVFDWLRSTGNLATTPAQFLTTTLLTLLNFLLYRKVVFR